MVFHVYVEFIEPTIYPDKVRLNRRMFLSPRRGTEGVRDQSQACLSYGLQGGGKPKVNKYYYEHYYKGSRGLKGMIGFKCLKQNVPLTWTECRWRFSSSLAMSQVVWRSALRMLSTPATPIFQA